MNIGIVGYADKRALIYPLIKLLQPLGEVLVVTNNRFLKRLIEGHNDFGHFLNVTVVVSDYTSDEVYEAIGHVQYDFDHVIYDFTNYIPSDLDVTYSVEGVIVEQDEKEFLELIEPINTKWLISASNKTEKGYVTIPFNQNLCSYLEQVETYKMLPATVTPTVVKRLSTDLSTHLNIPVKDIQKLLRTGWTY